MSGRGRTVRTRTARIRIAAAAVAAVFALVATVTTVVSVGRYCITSDGGNTTALPARPAR